MCGKIEKNVLDIILVKKIEKQQIYMKNITIKQM